MESTILLPLQAFNCTPSAMFEALNRKQEFPDPREDLESRTPILVPYPTLG